MLCGLGTPMPWGPQTVCLELWVWGELEGLRVWGFGVLGSWGVGELGSWGVGELGSWGVGELGSWGVGELGSWGVGEVQGLGNAVGRRARVLWGWKGGFEGLGLARWLLVVAIMAVWVSEGFRALPDPVSCSRPETPNPKP